MIGYTKRATLFHRAIPTNTSITQTIANTFLRIMGNLIVVGRILAPHLLKVLSLNRGTFKAIFIPIPYCISSVLIGLLNSVSQLIYLLNNLIWKLI